MKPLALLAAAALLSAPLAAGAAIVEIAFDSAGRFVHQAAVPPKNFVEVCGKLSRDARVGWKFDAAAPLDFNVHYHVGERVEFPEKRAAVSALAGELTAPSDQHYCWMWRNTGGAEVRMTVELVRR